MPTLMRLKSAHRRDRSTLPPDGLVISKKLAEVLGVKAGETVRVEVLQDKRPVVDVPVVALLDDISGLNAYMIIDALNRLMREGPRMSGAMLTTDPLHAAGDLSRAQGNAAGGQRHDPAGFGRQLQKHGRPRT